MTTPRLGAPELPTGQNASPETMNEALRWTEQGANFFVAKTRATTPPGSPTVGDCHIVTATATGDWTGWENRLTFRLSTSWEDITPIEGTHCYVQAEDAWFRYSGSAWFPAPGSGHVSTQTGTSYTADADDANGYVAFTNGSAVTFTIPPNSTTAFPIGTVIEMEQQGAGALTVSPGGGVTINCRGADFTLAGQYAIASVKKVAADTWTMTGDL